MMEWKTYGFCTSVLAEVHNSVIPTFYLCHKWQRGLWILCVIFHSMYKEGLNHALSNMFILLQIFNVFWNFTLHQSIFYFLKVTRSILNKILLLGLKISRYWISRLLTSLGWLQSFMRISFPSSIITIPFQLNRSLNKIYFRQSKVLQLLLWFFEADHC